MKRALLVAVIAGCGSKAPAAAPAPVVVGSTAPDPVIEPPPDAPAPAPDATAAPVDEHAVMTAELALMKTVEHTYLPEIQRCYKTGLKVDATLGGKITIDLALDADGKVTRAKASYGKQGAAADAMIACIDAAMPAWQFGKQPQATKYRFNLALKAD